MNAGLRHVDDGTCWCELDALREVALDALYPDRCQIPGNPATPNLGQRTCVLLADHAEPCRGSLERPGDSCHYCGGPTDLHASGPGCSICWTDIGSMGHADLKALFARSDLSLDPPRAEERS